MTSSELLPGVVGGVGSQRTQPLSTSRRPAVLTGGAPMFGRSHRSAALGAKAVLSSIAFLVASLAGLVSASATDAVGLTTEETDARPQAIVRGELTVTDSRLRDEPTERQRVAAHITVVEGQQLGGVSTLQDLFAREAGVGVFDATGSGFEKTIDLRGFAGGGVKVFLDGAPLNEPRNNSLSLELVLPAALERAEITRGSSAALAGGGSQAGVINLFTRSGERAGGRLDLSLGGFDTIESAAAGWGRSRQSSWFGAASLLDTGGHRTNAESRLGRVVLAGGRAVAGGELRLSLLGGRGEFGNPGALRPDELAANRRQAPFNELDFSDQLLTQAALNFSRPYGADLSLRASLFSRRTTQEILTTGRAAPAFGGFFLDSSTSLAGATAQLSGVLGHHEASGGLEWLDADTEARGDSTPTSDPGNVDRGATGSDNLTGRNTRALFLQDRWRPNDRWTLTVGGRWDEDRVAYRESLPDPLNVDARVYSEISLRGGVSWAWRPALTLYAAFGEGFLPPTVEELFSFPRFGSNPRLEPEDSRSLEMGLRRAAGRHQTQIALFRLITRNEIVFDPDSQAGLFGANVNAGATRRRGLEVVHRSSPRTGLSWFATASLLDAEFRNGPHRGRTVPLVPGLRLTLGVDLTLARGLALHGNALRVGSQVLANDDANLEPRLAPYTVVDARLVWDQAAIRGPGAGPRLFLAARNLLDEEYSSRGIFAFDFSTSSSSVFLTPAPGRQLSAGIEWQL